MKNICVGILIFACTILYASTGFAQDTAASKKWSFLVEPYLMFPNMNGTTGVGDLPDVSVDASPGDIFDRLQFGFMLFFEASRDKWAVNTDFIYMDLEQKVKTGMIINSGEVKAKQFAWELAGLYRVAPWLEAGLGGILNYVESGVNIKINVGPTTVNRNKTGSKSWLEPMLIARTQNKRGAKFVYMIRGEIGGFGIGSDFAWQAQVYAGYRFSKLFQLTAGYRVISLDYETGSSEERFLYDMDAFGPLIRFGFNF